MLDLISSVFLTYVVTDFEFVINTNEGIPLGAWFLPYEDKLEPVVVTRCEYCNSLLKVSSSAENIIIPGSQADIDDIGKKEYLEKLNYYKAIYCFVKNMVGVNLVCFVVFGEYFF